MKNRSNFMLRLASFLAIAVCVSTVMLSGLLARYVTSGSGSDSARVIKFGQVSITETTNKYVICPGVNLEKDVELSFEGSEASTFVFIIMQLKEPWDGLDNYNYTYDNYLDFSVIPWNESTKQGWKYHTVQEKTGYKNYVYYKELEPNEEITSADVISDGNITVATTITKDMINSLDNINISFQAIAVQANGFESITDAWNSVSSKYL